MKNFVICAFVAFFATTASAINCSFSLLPPQVRTDAGVNAGNLALADFNHDTYIDAVVVNRGQTFITYFPGVAGGGFGDPKTITTGESTQADVAALDWNDDGHADIILLYSTYYDAQNNPVYSHAKALYGHGDATFTAENFILSTQNPTRIALGDFNNDNKTDLAVLTAMGFEIYLHGANYPMSYNTPPAGTPVGALVAIASGDFDGDGKDDIAYSEDLGQMPSIDNRILVRFGKGDGTFETDDVILLAQDPALEVTPQSIATGDFNGDGKADIAVGNNDWRGTYTAQLSILISNGNRTFQSAVQYGTIRNSYDSAVKDIDGDGKLDVIVAETNANVLVFRGNGNGTFQQQQPFVSDTFGIQLADIDFNGSPDVIVTGFSGKLNVLKNSCAQIRLLMNSSSNPVNQGTDVTVSATATAPQSATPTGTITLTLGNNTLATGGLTVSTTLSDLTPGTYVVIATYSGDAAFAPTTATLNQVVVVPPFGAPPKLNATSVGGPVSLSWIATNGVDHYEVWRSNGAGFIKIDNAPTAQYSDGAVLSNFAYLYKVRGVATGGFVSDFSPVDPAVVVSFADGSVIPAATVIKLVHLTELRAAINALRNVYGMPNYGWAEGAPSVVKATQWLELRNVLNATRTTNGLPAVQYTDPSLSAGMPIKAVHVEELRTAVR